MTWIAWSLVPFYLGILMVISILFYAYRLYVGRPLLSEPVNFRNPLQWLLTALSVLVIHGRGFGFAAVAAVIILTRWFSGDFLGYIVAGLIVAALAVYGVVWLIDDRRYRQRLRRL
jgi:hypothetical protein